MDIQTYINEIKEDAKEFHPDNYCITFFTTSGFMGSNRNIKKIYKNIEDFENKFEEDVKNVDVMFGITVGIYEFD